MFKNKSIKTLAITACAIFLLGLFSCAESKPKYNDYNDHETAQFFKKNSDPGLKKAQDFFNAGQYGKALRSFEEVKDLTNPEVQYFYAISWIEIGYYDNAKLCLDNLRAGNSVFKDKATWYLALSNLKQEKTAECKNYLRQVPAGSEVYEKAQKLLKDLE